jgi:hypothetical protein
MKYYKVKNKKNQSICVLSQTDYTRLSALPEFKLEIVEEVSPMGISLEDATALNAELAAETQDLTQ